MKKNKADYLWQRIKEVGDYLKNKLPPHPNHPEGRNPYAHIAMCIKKKFNASYKDIDDYRFSEVLKFIDEIKNNQN